MLALRASESKVKKWDQKSKASKLFDQTAKLSPLHASMKESPIRVNDKDVADAETLVLNSSRKPLLQL